MRCDSCGKIIWFWQPTLWRLHTDLAWHDNEKCNPDDIHVTKHIIPSSQSIEDLNNTVNEMVRENKLNQKIKKQQEDW
jgi:hypothetical protein